MSTPRKIRHRVERTRNKHSRAVFHDGTIVIRLARGLNTLEEQIHIESLLRRMTRQVLEEKQKITIDPFRHLLNGGQSQTVVTQTGKRYIFSLRPDSKTFARRTADGFMVHVSPRVRREGLHRFFWNLLADVEHERIDALVRRINEQANNSRISKVRLKFASSQWGSCSPKKIVMLNAAMLFVPPSVLKYVTVHELAHLKHANHSAAFWREVEWMMPSYESAKELLTEYRLPSL